MLELQALLEQTATQHKHLCPRQVLGVRMGIHAAELFNLELPQSNKRLFAFVETDGCFADGVSVATGCWMGRRTMHLIDHGKVAVTFVDTQTERAIRVAPNSTARSRAIVYCPNEKSRWHTQLQAYQIMPTWELLSTTDVHLTISMAAILSRPGVRVLCDSCGEEIINERQVVVGERILCRSCAGETYFTRVD